MLGKKGLSMRSPSKSLSLALLIAAFSSEAAAKDREWNGIYGGVFVGDEWLGPLSLSGDDHWITPGLTAGGELGLNHQAGQIVFGLETDVALPDLEGGFSCD